MARVAAVLALILAATAGRAAPPANEAAFRALPNLLQNPSFEMDWMHNLVTVRTRFLLLEQSDWGYGQSDGQPDCWVLPEDARRDTTTARFGSASLRITGSAWQVVYLCGETDPRAGGAYYNPFRPLPANLLKHVHLGSLRFGAWCKTQYCWQKPQFTVTVEFSNGIKTTPVTLTAPFDAGTHDWQYQEIVVPPHPELGVAHAAVFKLTHEGRGTAWFDGCSAVEAPPPTDPNLLPPDAFRTSPDGTLHPVLWTWSRSTYYRFTGWSHENGSMLGGAAWVPAGYTSGRVIQLTVLPGDNLAVTSKPVSINQSEPRALRISAWVWADNLRWLEIMARDEHGEWIPQEDFAGAMGTDQEYRNRLIGAGSHDWEYVTKWFAPRRPVKQLTLWLCARGFDGTLMDRPIAGVVRFDGVELTEPGTPRSILAKRGLAIQRSEGRTSRGIRVVRMDLGERLWGTNDVRLILHNDGTAPAHFGPNLPVRTPDGKVVYAQGAAIRIPPGGEAVYNGQYFITSSTTGTRHYTLGGPAPVDFTVPPPLILRINQLYVYSDDALAVGIQVNISRRSLSALGSLRVVVAYPGGQRAVKEFPHPAAAFWTPDRPRPAMLADGYVSAANLIAFNVDRAGLPVHPFTDPVRDCIVEAVIADRSGRTIARASSERFGFLHRPRPASAPASIHRTSIAPDGAVMVDGRPYIFNCFPTDPTDLGVASATMNFPKEWIIQAIPFPGDLIIPPGTEREWHSKIRDFVMKRRHDPHLFGWRFAHDGEITFWNRNWREVAASERKAAEWVRDADPNHVILGAGWLLGHRALTPDTARAFGFLDVVETEMGLTWIPNAEAARRDAGRSFCVVAGMECYYTQSAEMIRWRMYRAIMEGVNGIGICPSGMLAAKPELVSLLRGLHAEVEAIRPFLAGALPLHASSGNPAVSVWAKRTGNEILVVAARTSSAGPLAGTITVPSAEGTADVLFEGRNLPVRGGKITDEWKGPYAVHVYRLKVHSR
ncbi:MAG: hypothetical protein ACP5VE_15200 [Chthonomonadales bacterium]